MTVRFVMENSDEIVRKLQSLEGAVRKQVLEKVALEALEPMLEETNRRTPVEEGDLKRGNKKHIRKSRENFVEAEVANTAPHAHLVEFGHRNVKGGRLGKGGRQVGTIPPHPFMRPAFDATQAKVCREVGERIGREVTQRWSK